MTRLNDLLAARGFLLADGATGTNFQDMGIEPGVAPEEWVTDAPDKVLELHRRFVDAGERSAADLQLRRFAHPPARRPAGRARR